MNPLLNQAEIQRAMEEDPEAGLSEYGAEFRRDVSAFIEKEVVEAVTVKERFELPPVDSVVYEAFTDMAGGSGQDSATLAIGHNEARLRVIDCVREIRPPFSPEQCVKEFSDVLKRYSVRSVVGDRWAGQWPIERFRVHGIEYQVSELNKSKIYIEALPLLNAGEVELLDNEKLKKQLCSLERRVHSGGRQSVDHPRGKHDDVSNSVCGALVLLTHRSQKLFPELRRWKELRNVQEANLEQ
jgi:hypothetical protein